MRPLSFMMIAGETSGDILGAELVAALRSASATIPSLQPDAPQPLVVPLEPRFFGAGGARMAAEGVDLAFDMTRHAVIGVVAAIRKLATFKRFMDQLLELALERQPDAVLLVDFAGFNRRFAHALQRRVSAQRGGFHNWRPRIVQYVSPQVWASRPGRARLLAQDIDLLLSIFPFEPEWYARRVPHLRVEYVGHPVLDRFPVWADRRSEPGATPASRVVLLLPGSRRAELKRHLPVMQAAADRIARASPVRFAIVLPDEELARMTREFSWPPGTEIRVGGLPEALSGATIALASAGTVTMECAFFGVPTVTIYKASWAEYQIARRIVQVNHVAMPNLLAGESVYPELIQQDATPERLADEAVALLASDGRRKEVQRKLAAVIASLGAPGAGRRAAHAVLQLLQS